ncbi:MAG: Mut7-C RNAse domain-containing protein [Syntrophobacteraceae bacterium]
MSGGQYPGKRFAVDIMLGKLAKWLRVLGFDAPSMLLDDRVRVDGLLCEGIIPVTRREKLRDIEGVLFVRNDHQFAQLKELISSLSIGIEELRPFSRCSLCNAELLQIPKGTVFGAVPDYVIETASDFRKCPECARVYWPGSHRQKMFDKLESVTGWDLREGG